MKETHIYKITLEGESLEAYKAGKLSIIDTLSDALEISQENIEWLGMGK